MVTYHCRVTRVNPPAVPRDTSPEAWRLQMRAIRDLTPSERLRRWEEFNDALLEMEVEAFRRRFPLLTERQRFLARMRLRYGAELAEAIWPDAAGATT
jgi:hypothetical protein